MNGGFWDTSPAIQAAGCVLSGRQGYVRYNALIAHKRTGGKPPIRDARLGPRGSRRWPKAA